MISSVCKAAAGLGVYNCEAERQTIQQVEERFVNHIANFGLNYGTKEEYEFRFKVFQETDHKLIKINEEEGLYFVDHNQFSTMTKGEKRAYLGKKPNTEEVESYV